jgi:hypothetical protein
MHADVEAYLLLLLLIDCGVAALKQGGKPKTRPADLPEVHVTAARTDQ